jgi:hypothetical protein
MSGAALMPDHRHCERSEAIQCNKKELDCFVASLLAMTRDTVSGLGAAVDIRHARACPGHPRLSGVARRKTWMAAINPAMTAVSIQLGQSS